MKRLFIVLFFTISYFEVHGQSFLLTELINMTKMDIDNFDTYVSNKGFKFLESKENEYLKGITYAFNQSSYSKTADKFITLNYEYFGETNKNVTFQTSKTVEYLNIKNQISPLGFKFKETKTFEGATFLVYTKGKYELELISFQSETDSGTTLATYEISITLKNE